MNRYISYLSLVLIVTLSMFACADSYMGVEQVKTDSTKPDKITVNEVIPKSGALEINFSIPKGNPDISQIVASYINKRGEKMQFKVSRYSSSILVEGLTGTDEVTVELACIDNSGNVSEITYAKGSPLISPLEIAFNTMKVDPAFGGVKVEWQNMNARPFAIHFLTEDTLQKGVVSFVEDPSKTIYSTDSLNTYAYVRPYPSKEQKFGFIVSDKWGNRSDTLINFITPYKEEKIDYNLVEEVTYFNPTYYGGSRDYDTYAINPSTGIQNDGNRHGTAYAAQTMFNGIRSGNRFYGYKFVKNLSSPDPADRILVNDVYATFDLNMKVRLSRVLIFPRTHISYTYNRSSPKRWRIYGTNDDNKDRWSKFPETWTLIGEYVGKEPGDRDNLTAEEIEWFNQNQEYTISEDNVNPNANTTESFRYMRLHLMESYNPELAYYTINEFEMYGDIEEFY